MIGDNMPTTSPIVLEQFDLAEALRGGKAHMLAPQDLPGRYGRVVEAIDRWLELLDCPAVVAGGWAVWRHGYAGRLTQDIDIVLPADRMDEVLRSVHADYVTALDRLLARGADEEQPF